LCKPISGQDNQYSQRTGRATDKDQVFAMLKTCFKKADSKENFFENVKECGLTTYDRGNKTTGIIFGNRKFRFKRLGFTEEILQGLDKSVNRQKELSKVRGKDKNAISRNR